MTPNQIFSRWGTTILSAVSLLGFLDHVLDDGLPRAVMLLLNAYDNTVIGVVAVAPKLLNLSLPAWYLEAVALSAIGSAAVAVALRVIVQSYGSRPQVPDYVTGLPRDKYAIEIKVRMGRSSSRLLWISTKIFQPKSLAVWGAILFVLSYTLLPLIILVVLAIASVATRLAAEIRCVFFALRHLPRRWRNENWISGGVWHETDEELSYWRRHLFFKFVWTDYLEHRQDRILSNSIDLFPAKMVNVPLFGPEPLGLYAGLVLFKMPSVMLGIAVAMTVIVLTGSFAS